MELAQRPGLKNDRRLLRAFGGLNEGYACTEAEYAAGENFSARDFPALSTRPPRCRLRTLRDVNGLYCRSGLLAVCGRDLHYIPEQGEEVTLPQALTDGPKTLVGLGAKVLIFPDKAAFDTATGQLTLWVRCGRAKTPRASSLPPAMEQAGCMRCTAMARPSRKIHRMDRCF